MRRRLLLALGLVAATSACHLPPWSWSGYKPIHVVVTNNYSQAMEIHVFSGGASIRIGLVHPGLTGDFEVPRSMTGKGPVEFIAFPNADTRTVARSGEMILQQGAYVDFVITAQLFNSTATIRQ